jgi:hypothetical protein
VLYSAGAFEPLADAVWDEARVGDAIREIVKDTEDALRGPKLLWRADPWDSWHATSPLKCLYVGAAGVIWALDALCGRGHAETRLDLPALAVQTLELFRTRPDLLKGTKLPDPPESALLNGETGILLVAWRLAPNAELADALLELVHANVDNEADELMWGAPGTLHAAARCSSGPARAAGGRHGWRAPTPCGRGAAKTASGCSACTARSSGASHLLTGSSATSRCSCRAATCSGRNDARS